MPEHLLGDGAPDTQKNELKPWRKKEWCIPKLSGEFVARMEDVLDLYHEEYDRERPVVCFDESSKLDFTHFKRHKRERLQLNGTG